MPPHKRAGMRLKDVLSMRVLRVSLLRFSRSGFALLFVPLAVYVILTYKVSTNVVTKHSGQHSETESRSTGNVPGNQHQQHMTDVVKGAGYRDVFNSSKVDNTVSSKVEDHSAPKGDNPGALEDSSTSKGDNPGDAEEDEGRELGPLGLDQLKPENLLLAGVPRDRRVELTIGVVTVSREKGDYFFDTLNSLLSRSTMEDQRKLSIVVMLADRNESYNDRVLQNIQRRYARELAEGVLLVIRGASTEFLFKESKIKRTYNDSVDRVLWRSKQNLDYAAIIEFCTNLSTYYLHVEDDVVAAQMYLRHLRDFIKANARTPWAMLELSPHGFIGKLFKNKDLPKLVMILRAFYLEQPCDFLIKPYFINIMTQKKPIVRKSALFFHKGQFSSLKNVTRKIDKYSGGAVVRKNAESAVRKIAMVTRAHKNPPAKVYVNMTEFNGNQISGAYDPMTLGFFWARDVKAGQYVRILFNTPQKVERLVVETGFSDKERKDILRKGSVEMGLDVPNMAAGTNRCPNTHKMGEFQDGSFDATLTLKDDVRCINIVVDQTQTEWLIIRQILVFVTKVPVPPKM